MIGFASWILFFMIVVAFTIVAFEVCDYRHGNNYGKNDKFELTIYSLNYNNFRYCKCNCFSKYFPLFVITYFDRPSFCNTSTINEQIGGIHIALQ